ncbi:MAG: non-canonical purine NTP pyrophosphatase [Verrucomicrobia bacterium]|nr:non-canonical purine NTP pyrophosphatase [Verrucomicrobiota bacterium]
MSRILILATRNLHKVGEIRSILGDGFTCLSLRDLPSPPEVIEDADSFAGNARKKAVELARWITEIGWTPPPVSSPQASAQGESSGLILADDSGLEVDALNGAPGIHSARFAALDSGAPGNSSDEENNAKLLRLLEPVPTDRRSARFRCVLALATIPGPGTATAQPEARVFDGVCEGTITTTPSGGGGFGYDPLFTPSGYDRSFAELGAETKNQISHRSAALAKLRGHLLQDAATAKATAT